MSREPSQEPSLEFKENRQTENANVEQINHESIVLTSFAQSSGFFICTLTIPQKWTSTQFYLLYWLPSPLQFSSFMILPLFYAEIYHRRSNLVYKWLIRPFFLALEVGMVAYMVAWSWIESMRENEVKNT